MEWASEDISVPDIVEDAACSHSPHSLAAALSPFARYRSLFPSSVYAQLKALFDAAAEGTGAQHKSPPHAVDIGGASSLAATELMHRGFRVTAIQGNERLAVRAQDAAATRGLQLQLAAAAATTGGSVSGAEPLPAGSADLVTIMHGVHLLPHPGAALTETARVLRPGGHLAVAWNDGNLSSPFVRDMEDLLQRVNPECCHTSRQHTPEHYMRTLQQHGGAFCLESYSVHPHSLLLESPAHMADLFASFSALRGPLSAASGRRKELYRELRRLVERHFPDTQAALLPLEAKLYIMRKRVEGESATGSSSC